MYWLKMNKKKIMFYFVKLEPLCNIDFSSEVLADIFYISPSSNTSVNSPSFHNCIGASVILAWCYKLYFYNGKKWYK